MYELRYAFITHKNQYGDEFTESTIFVVDVLSKEGTIIYKGKPDDTPKELLEKEVERVTNLRGMVVYHIRNN